ncbi:hypothetical protein Hanom_Chr17g01568841 [Helianthus anomalus]
MTAAVAAVNNAMSAVGVNSGLHNGYLYALKKKTPYVEVPMLNRNAAEELNAAVACFDSLIFPVVEDLSKLINEPFVQDNGGSYFCEQWILRKMRWTYLASLGYALWLILAE